jgi:succinate dehydrogenase/fumarate reductase flavoprotein subunit
VNRGRRVYLDFRNNGTNFDPKMLIPEAQEYLARSNAIASSSPLGRLLAMNPEAYDLYKTNGIDLSTDILEIAVCAQHNNGGLATGIWWESENLKHLFPVGEVNGSHGVKRPGGSALNSGQVGSLRAAEYIASCRKNSTLDINLFRSEAEKNLASLMNWLETGRFSITHWSDHQEEYRQRMTAFGAHIRSENGLKEAVTGAWRQWRRLQQEGCLWQKPAEMAHALQTRQLCFAHVAYLEAALFSVQSSVGSRGSALVLADEGEPIHSKLGGEWRFKKENPDFRKKKLETYFAPEDGSLIHRWVNCRDLPTPDAWFETTWAAFKNGEIYE